MNPAAVIDNSINWSFVLQWSVAVLAFYSTGAAIWILADILEEGGTNDKQD